MNLITKRQLPNVNNERIGQLNSPKRENNIQYAQQNLTSFKQITSLADKFRSNGNKRNKDVRFDDSENIKQEKRKTTTTTREHLNDRNTNNSMMSPKQDFIPEQIVHPRLQELKRSREDQQRKLPISIHSEHSPTRIKSTKQIFDSQFEENEMNNNFLTQQNSIAVRESAKSIRESVTQLMRNEVERKKQIQKDEELFTLLNRRRRSEQDHRQIENEYLMQQQTMLSKSTALNEMLSFKKELEKSERQREQLSDRLELSIKTSDEKDKVVSKTLLELKDITENCDTFERQNLKLQNDLTLALEKLEEMTEEAERFAQESLNSQKQLADSEQKREEFKIQAQETIKQWNSRVKKLEKDIERYKIDSTQMIEKNEQLIKENLTLKEQITKTETNLTETNINYNQLEEQFKQNENNFVQLHSIHSSQQMEIASLKETVNQLESQLLTNRQRLSQTDKEKQNYHGLLQEEITHRNNLHSKLKQSEQDIGTINTSYSQLQNERKDLLQKLQELEKEKDIFLKEKTKYLSIENNYEELKKKTDSTKIDYTRSMKALQIDYENKLETIQMQLSDEKSQNTILQRHELEHKNLIEKLQDKLMKYDDENTQGQYTIESLSRELNDKSRLTNEFESKIMKLTNEILKKDKDYQNFLQNIHNDLIYCTECLSNDSNKPFLIESVTNSHDEIDLWSSKLKAHLTWLKQELDIHHNQENKLRQELANALDECETDRKYFTSELSKREILINQLTNNYQENSSYNKQRLLTEDQTDQMDHQYQQFQIMIDAVKQELRTAKVQLLS